MEKNIAGQIWIVKAWDETDHTVKAGDAANITANLRIDGGAANAVDDVNPTELEGGYYVFDITQAESNGDYILICPSSTTANIQVEGVPKSFTTVPANFSGFSIESSGSLLNVGVSRPTGAVIADAGNGAAGFATDLSQTDDDYWTSWVKFTTGALVNQVKKIKSYNGTTKFLTFTSAYTATPAVGDAFDIIVE